MTKKTFDEMGYHEEIINGKKIVTIELLEEEVEGLLDLKEVVICVDENVEVKIKLPTHKRMLQRLNILERYDNKEYWDEENEN